MSSSPLAGMLGGKIPTRESLIEGIRNMSDEEVNEIVNAIYSIADNFDEIDERNIETQSTSTGVN